MYSWNATEAWQDISQGYLLKDLAISHLSVLIPRCKYMSIKLEWPSCIQLAHRLLITGGTLPPSSDLPMITLEIMESRTLFHWILLKIVVPLSSTVEFHPPQRKVCQESVAKNHRYQGTNFLQATVSCYPVYWRHDVLVLYFEKKLIGMIVERNMADPGYEHWNFLQNYRQ
ncbi:hypothetical protein QQP08_017800 [Theobroma cacao]|nr:hypothetical protein QQP08_017800 [Theobroma cacao]